MNFNDVRRRALRQKTVSAICLARHFYVADVTCILNPWMGVGGDWGVWGHFEKPQVGNSAPHSVRHSRPSVHTLPRFSRGWPFTALAQEYKVDLEKG